MNKQSDLRNKFQVGVVELIRITRAKTQASRTGLAAMHVNDEEIGPHLQADRAATQL